MSPKQSLKSWAFRHGLNLWPCYRGSGGRVRYFSGDWRSAEIGLKLGWRTRNYVGTIFGGSLYGAVDPIYMLMLIQILGREYIVWDKAASIRFRKPGRGRLTARFELTEQELSTIRELAAQQKSIDRVYVVEFRDEAGDLVAAIEKTLYIKRK